jgi:hypothetical protein
MAHVTESKRNGKALILVVDRDSKGLRIVEGHR